MLKSILALALASAALAQTNSIKIGNFTAYTGSNHEYGVVARAEAAYFQMINDRGGINGHKIDFISLDSASEPGKALPLTRKLVEEDGVLLIFSTLGTEDNLAIRAYLNEKKVPQLFIQSSSALFDDPKHFPWTMGFFATYRTEGLVYAQYVRDKQPNAKVAVLYPDDDAGKEYLAGIREGIGKPGAIVKELSYNVSDDTVDAQIAALKTSGAGVLFNMAMGSMVSKAIRKVSDLDWHPLQFIPNASLSVAAFLEPAGLDKATGIISNARSKGWSRQSRRDPAVQDFLQWMKKYNPDASLRDQNNVAGYERAEALVEVLRRCADDLTRVNVMKQAASLDITLSMLRPGIRVKTSPEDYQPIKDLYLVKFDGASWIPLTP